MKPLRLSHGLRALAMLAGMLALSACQMTPHANVGVDVNYYNGGFHVKPNAHVGISGRPDRH